MGYRAVVLGASGFAGAELLRLIAGHGGIELVAAGAATRAGRPVADVYPHLPYAGLAFLPLEEAVRADCDVLFASLPHTHAMRLLAGAAGRKVVDLGGDFRLRDAGAYRDWYGEEHVAPSELGAWVYGLTEWHREEVAGAERVANPGCYPAAAILAVAPLLSAGLIRADGIHIDAKSGVSGAGRAGGEGFDFSSANENLRPYGVTGHRHIAEIEQELSAVAGASVTVGFVPHLVPMTRGLLATCIAPLACRASSADLIAALAERYRGERFVRVLGEESLPETRRVTGTNVAEVTARADPRTGRALAFAALDNLGKGAAGQALQNANLMLGLEEGAGLPTAGMVP